MNAFRSSLRMNAGTSVVNGTSDNSFVSLYVSPEISAKRFTSLIWIFAIHESALLLFQKIPTV